MFNEFKMEVLYSDDVETIRQYLSTSDGVLNINNHDDDRGVPLYHACENNRNDVVDVLIEFGADVNFLHPFLRETPLFRACFKGHIDIVHRLLNAGADPNIPVWSGLIPIMYSAFRGHLDIVKLLTIYTDFNYTDKEGHPIFNYALSSENKEMVDYIFDFCNNINHVDKKGRSYLHNFIFLKNKQIIQILLDKGIDINIQDDNGKKAYDYTRDPEILEILNKYSN